MKTARTLLIIAIIAVFQLVAVSAYPQDIQLKSKSSENSNADTIENIQDARVPQEPPKYGAFDDEVEIDDNRKPQTRPTKGARGTKPPNYGAVDNEDEIQGEKSTQPTTGGRRTKSAGVNWYG